MKNSIIAFVTILFIFYLAGSFTFVSFDIKEWSEESRAFICFVSLSFASMAFGMLYENKK